MSCYHPLVGIPKFDKDGKKYYKVIPFEYRCNEAYEKHKFVFLPCGHCIGCRQDQSKDWANRLILESLYHDNQYFITLTYDDEHIPIVPSVDMSTGEFTWHSTLVKRDIQLFLKRLRSRCPGCDIRYYIAGEYGEKTERAHWHAIIFDIPDVINIYQFGMSETGYKYYRSQLLEDCWISEKDGSQLGFVSVAPANYFTMKYCAAYVTKKIGNRPNQEYYNRGIEPPCSMASKRPAIGYRYFEDHPECIEKERIILALPDGPININIPRYFRKKFRELDPVRADKIAEKNLKKSEDRLNAELEKTDLLFIDYLAVKEANHAARIKARTKI